MHPCKRNYFVFGALIAIICIAVKSQTNPEYKVVETNNGKVRGVRKSTLIKGVDYYSFKGIPYAKSPTGELRFKPPEPVESWAPNELDASDHGPICIQPIKPTFENVQEQSENCLFLNIYVPAHETGEKLSVMVFIHGGSYGVGSGNTNWHGPDFLIEQGVILVTINYRLGVLGFMSLGTPEYSGNMGLKDQQLAMKWVHSNIEHFSGDNQRITLFGESSGGSSTHLHVLSSESREYFRNAIPMSGVADNVWAIYEKDDHLPLAYKIAEDLNEPKHSFGELIAFLKTVSPENFAKYESGEGFELRSFQADLVPVIEDNYAIRPFIVDFPEQIYSESEIDVDVIFSFCSSENQKIAREIREFYLRGTAVDEKALKQYIDLVTDMNFVYGTDKSVKQHAAKSTAKTFYLQFSVNSKANLIKPTAVNDDGLPMTELSISPADDLCYVFFCEHEAELYDEMLRTKDDEQSRISLWAIENITKLFANFAKYGDPVHDDDPISGFLPVQNDRLNFLDVTNDGLKLGVNPNQRVDGFWTQIEQKIKEIKSKRMSVQ